MNIGIFIIQYYKIIYQAGIKIALQRPPGVKYNLKSFYKSELVNSKGFYTEAEEGEEEILFKTFPIEKVLIS